MDGGVGLGRDEGAWLDGWCSGMRERGMGRAGWMRESGEEESRGQGWIDGGVR